MEKSRRIQIEQAAKSWADRVYGDNGTYLYDEAFIVGAEWADENLEILNRPPLLPVTDEEIDMAFELVETKSKLDMTIEALENSCFCTMIHKCQACKALEKINGE